jgi:hypothetical protein
VAKTAAVSAVLPVRRAAVLVARQVGSAGAVEAAPVHCRKPVELCLVGAVEGHIDTRQIDLHWDVDNRVRLDALSQMFVALATVVPVVLLLLKVELGNDTLELREVSGVRRAVSQVLLERLVEARVVRLAKGTVVVAALLLVLLKVQAVLCGSALALTNFAQLSTRRLLYADDQKVLLKCFYCFIQLPIKQCCAVFHLFLVWCRPVAGFSFHKG